MDCGKSLILPALLGLGLALHGADFEIGPQGGTGTVGDLLPAQSSSQAQSSAPAPDDSGQHQRSVMRTDIPPLLEAGDVPTAYVEDKYGLRTDLKFHRGGGILGKAYLGIFSRFFLGGAVELRNFIGAGDLHLTRDDAQLLARLQVFNGGSRYPALAVGWDGPAYDGGEDRGLYVAVSQAVPTALARFGLHGSVNSGRIEQFVGSRDLRAAFALTAAVGNTVAFTEIDEVLNPQGSRWNAGLRVTWNPITLGLEFRDLASARPGVQASRLLRVSWHGHF